MWKFTYLLQNEKITKLKIDNNPFAKGFRETGQASTKRKRSELKENQQKDSEDDERVSKLRCISPTTEDSERSYSSPDTCSEKPSPGASIEPNYRPHENWFGGKFWFSSELERPLYLDFVQYNPGRFYQGFNVYPYYPFHLNPVYPTFPEGAALHKKNESKNEEIDVVGTKEYTDFSINKILSLS